MRLHDQNASFRFNQSGLKKFLGDLECDVMELVWKKCGHGQDIVKVRDIYEPLHKSRGIAYTTVMTTMVRLAEKGILNIVDKAGLANCYAPAEPRKEFIRKNIARVFDTFFKEYPEEASDYLANRKSGSRTAKRSR